MAESRKPLDLDAGREFTHRAHRFPGKFHPPLVKEVLEQYPDYMEVADPMCGSGTVGVEGVAKCREVLCADLDPLSCLMTRGKTHPVDPDDLRNVAKRILSGVIAFPDPGTVDEEQAGNEIENNIAGTPSIKPLNLFHWFEPYVAVGYSRLLSSAHHYLEIESKPMNDAIRMALASIIRQISRADPQPVSGLEVTSVRREQLENGLEFDVEKSFRRAIDRIASGYKELQSVGKLGSAIIVEGDARNFQQLCEIHDFQPTLILTSPPYCNAIEYTRRHRLEYEWLGLFEGCTKEEQKNARLEQSRDFIGSQTLLKEQLDRLPTVPHTGVQEVLNQIEKNQNQPKKADFLRKYFLDAYDWIDEVYQTLPDGGIFAMTIGPSTSYGQRIETPLYLQDIAEGIGFDVIEKHKYQLTNNKMQYPTNGPTTDTESLIQMQKDGV